MQKTLGARSSCIIFAILKLGHGEAYTVVQQACIEHERFPRSTV